MQGFYGVYCTSAAGSAAFGLLLHAGRVYGVDPAGGDVQGTYVERGDGGVDLSLLFSWPTGTALVTGQVLAQSMSVNSDVTISAATLAGAHQAVDLPVGRVNVRLVHKAST